MNTIKADGSKTQYCTFYLDGHHFGIDVDLVQEVNRYQEITRVPLASSMIRGLINLRGQIVTAIDLRKRLGLAEALGFVPDTNVVINTPDGPFSFLVDEIGDVLIVDNNEYEETPDSVGDEVRALISCVYKLESSLLLAIDVQKIISIDLASISN